MFYWFLSKVMVIKDIMKIKNIIKHKDQRGLIINILASKFQSCALIYSKKNSVRANHYHKKDWHYCYVLYGKIKYIYGEIGSEKKNSYTVKKGELFYTPPMLVHAMYFLEDTEFLTLGNKTRTQKSYEADLVRVPNFYVQKN
mgnify:CR=1 FL=1